MTEIHIDRKKDITEISLFGHTETRVCAGISTLLAALEGVLMNDYPGGYKYKDNGDGCAEVIMPSEAKECFMMFFIGIKRLEKSFPEEVSVIYREQNTEGRTQPP